jgi:hypothetical protein
VATVALIDDLLGDLIQEFPFLLCEFLVGEDARVAQRGQLTKLGGDAGDRAAGRGLRRRRLSGSRGRPDPLPTARAAAECSAAASPSQAVAAASIGPEPGPVYIRAELISGGSAAHVSPSDRVKRRQGSDGFGDDVLGRRSQNRASN